MMALPVFSPRSIPIKAAGMFSNPFVTCSRLCSLPCRWTINKFHKWQANRKAHFGRLFLQGSYLVFSSHLRTSFNHPISLLRDSGCLCSHLLCMKPSILSCLKIMVRRGYGPEEVEEVKGITSPKGKNATISVKQYCPLVEENYMFLLKNVKIKASK